MADDKNPTPAPPPAPVDLSSAYGDTGANIAPAPAGFMQNLSQTVLGTPHPIDQAVSELKDLYNNPIETVKQSGKKAIMLPVDLAYQLVHHPVDTITGITGGPEFAEALKKKDVGGMAGAVAGGLVNVGALEKGAEVAPEAATHIAETAKTFAKSAVEEGKAAVSAKAPEGSLEAGFAKLGGKKVGQVPVAPKAVEVAAPEMHPALKAISEKYTTEPVSDSSKYEPSFIRPDGKAVYLGSTWHPDAINSVPEGKVYGGTEEGRTKFINDTGAIRVRPNMSQREGQTFHFTVPENGVTEAQVDALRKTAATIGGRGNLMFETASKPSQLRTNMSRPEDWQYKGAHDVEPILGKIGVLPGQKVNLSEAYGETGKYIGGHLRVGVDFPGNFEKDNFASRRTTGNNMNDPESLITGEEVQKGMTPANSHRGFPNEDAYQDVVHSKSGLTPADIAQKYPRIFNNPEDENAEPWAKQAAATAKTQGGGFTIDPRTGESPTKGYQVEAATEIRPKPLDHPATPADIQKFYNDNKAVFDKHPELQIGGYNNELNASVNTPNREAAIALAKKLDQVSVWDHEKGEEIPTGGKSEKTSFPDYPLEQRLKDLKGERETPESPKSPLSTVPLLENPLKVPNTKAGETPLTIDVAKALNKFSKNAAGRAELNETEPAEMVKRAISAMEDEAKYQLAQNNTGEHWYTTEIADHDASLQDIRPELKDSAKMSLFKMSEAVLSSGQKPYRNVKAAVMAWDAYKNTGKFPEVNPVTGKSWGPRGIKGYGNAMGYINRLVSEKGEQGASEWLLGKHPVSELRQYNKDVKGKMTDERYGTVILGDKRGPFAQNLHGIESEFTADMWVSRTWNRLMGTMEFDPESGEISSDSPRNQTERKLMKESFEHLATKLGKSTSSAQAIMWYYEQALYRAHGVPKESWSFSDAAKRVQEEDKYGTSSVRAGDNESKHGGQAEVGSPQENENGKGIKELGPGIASLIKPGKNRFLK